jgi:hypothetical protein
MVFLQNNFRCPPRCWELEEPKGPKGPTGSMTFLRPRSYRTNSGVRLCWELEEPEGPEAPKVSESINAFSAVLSTEERDVGPPYVGRN